MNALREGKIVYSGARLCWPKPEVMVCVHISGVPLLLGREGVKEEGRGEDLRLASVNISGPKVSRPANKTRSTHSCHLDLPPELDHIATCPS